MSSALLREKAFGRGHTNRPAGMFARFKQCDVDATPFQCVRRDEPGDTGAHDRYGALIARCTRFRCRTILPICELPRGSFPSAC